MIKKLRLLLVGAGLVLAFSAAPAPVEAQSIWGACDGSSSAICADKDGAEATDMIKNIINLFLYAIGILSVIMIVHSGLKYVSSRGDAEAVKSAKNTLLYAVIGLIVALLAFTIVNFVIEAFGQTSSSPPPPPEGQSGPRVD